MFQPNRIVAGRTVTGECAFTRPRQILGTLPLLILAACGGGGGGGGQSGRVGEETDKPGSNETFFIDENQGGNASRLRIAEMFWGRLVDVHGLDALGNALVAPHFRDFVVNENIQSDGTNFELDINPITQETRLIILRVKGAPDTGSGSFESLLRQATSSMPPILPKDEDAPPDFSFISRNATLVVRFDDHLDDSVGAVRDLGDTVKILTGYSPTTPFETRILFSPHHGGIANGAFHSTRVLVDMTVSEAEAADLPTTVPINSIGLPASLSRSVTQAPNVTLRIPSRTDFASGQFEILTTISGAPMATTGNGPVDFDSPTIDVLRAMRSGNTEDENNGFLLDLKAPEILGGWAITVDSSAADPVGQAGFDFVIDLTFTTVCSAAPRIGNILSVGSEFLEVTQPAGDPNPVTGEVANVHVRVLTEEPLGSTTDILGQGLFLSTFSTGSTVNEACWVNFTPPPGAPPGQGIDPNVVMLVRFSEPMDPESVLPFDTFSIVRGPQSSPPAYNSTVVGSVASSGDLKDFTFTPVLPLAHASGTADAYHVELIGGDEGVTDLAGNKLASILPFVDFTLDEAAAETTASSIVIRFGDPDELPSQDAFDWRGQLFYDLDKELIMPRQVSYQGIPVDRNNPVPSIMIPFPPGVQTPLSALGSKLMTVWRYCDAGWRVRDENKYNVDVVGLNWSPIGGQIIGDFFERFEIRLSHSVRLPDEFLDMNLLPAYSNSGLLPAPSPYTANILEDPLDPQVVIHNRELGYVVNPVDLFVSGQGTFFFPFPLNRPVPSAGHENYTWRNTAVLAVGGSSSAGIPLAIESTVGLEPFSAVGTVAPPGQVPSFGLPLLMEYRCFPSDSGIGLNAFDVSLAVNSSARPNFRAFSTGGTNTSQQQIRKDPDLEITPSGGFNPGSTPPGKPTANNADNTFYIGQLDIVIRVSRVHSVWIDTAVTAADFFEPVVEPSPDSQPSGTLVQVDYRGADSFVPSSTTEPFDSSKIDPYGDPPYSLSGSFVVNFNNGISTWSSDIDGIDGARYVQLRVSFFNNIETGLSPVFSAIGIPFRPQ
jgi:hypothetical protein